MSSTDSRDFDLVLFGATGFTGALVADYVAREAPPNLRWALAGRNAAKLESVRAQLKGKSLPGGLLIADATDQASLQKVASQTKVVCTTVGPYSQHGLKLVAACASNGTHYCDLTGEVTFVRAAIDGYHEEAKRNRARIVPCCGFDSIPSDIGVWMMHQAFAKEGATLQSVKLVVTRMKGTFSGGTVASGIEMMRQTHEEPRLAALMQDPYALVPNGKGPDKNETAQAIEDVDVGAWTAPFFMANINTRVVRRTNDLLGYAYGQNFRYEERMRVGKGLAGMLKAQAIGQSIVRAPSLLKNAKLRSWIASFLPKSGEGPSREEREAGHFTIHFYATGIDRNGAEMKRVGMAHGTSDPGYGETSKMMAEAAMCLALDEARLPQDFGLVTPASTMGDALLERLQQAGMTWEVSEP